LDSTVTELNPPTSFVRARMRAQPRIGTAPEYVLRRILHGRGFRYRVGYKVPGLARRTIDIAFPRKKVAVFVDGCFWHRCPEHSVPVKNNAEWWRQKLDANVARDRSTQQHLEELGWRVLRFWEHADMDVAADVVGASLFERLESTGPTHHIEQSNSAG
jgi:DNA mismatch endonuclease (patch repair protein)